MWLTCYTCSDIDIRRLWDLSWIRPLATVPPPPLRGLATLPPWMMDQQTPYYRAVFPFHRQVASVGEHQTAHARGSHHRLHGRPSADVGGHLVRASREAEKLAHFWEILSLNSRIIPRWFSRFARAETLNKNDRRPGADFFSGTKPSVSYRTPKPLPVRRLGLVWHILS